MGIQINGQTDTITAIDGSITVGTNLTVPGVLSYEDVTNIDAVGVITARSGIRVTSGSVGIGTDNPQGTLSVGGNISLDVALGTIPSRGGITRHTNGYTYFAGKSDGSGAILTNGDGTATVRAESPGGSNGFLLFETGNGAERLRITSDGVVGINSTVPVSGLKLDVTGGTVGIRKTDGLIYFANDQNTYGTSFATRNSFIGRADNAGNHITTADGGYGSSDNQMTIGHNGSGGILFGTTDAGPFPSGRMHIDADGRIRTPNQISFLQTGMNGTDFNNGTLKGGQSDHNVGGHYDTSTGIFTAPIAGYYQFGCAVLVSASTGRLEGYIGKNSAATVVNFNGTGTTYDGPSATCIFNLAANDNVRVNRVSGTAYAASHGQHYFWGRLLG